MDQPTTFKDNSLWQSGAAVADSLAEFEGAMDRLVGRMEITSEQIAHLKEIKARAENIVNQVVGFSQRAVSDVKSNPKSYFALAAIVGLFLLSRSRGARTSHAALPEVH